MPMRAFAPRLRFPLFHKQGNGLPTGLDSQALFDVLDALAGKAELLVGVTSRFIPTLQGYDLPRLGSVRATVGYRPADLPVEDSFTDPQKIL